MAEFCVKIDAMWTNDGTFESFKKDDNENSEDQENEDLMSDDTEDS